MVAHRPLGTPTAWSTPSMTTTTRRPVGTQTPAPRPRRGWRERIEPGVYRIHRIACASRDARPGRRCGCAYQILVPGTRPGITRAVTVRGSVTQARAERRRLQAAGRPQPRCTGPAPEVPDVGELAEHWIHAQRRARAQHLGRSRGRSCACGSHLCWASLRSTRSPASTWTSWLPICCAAARACGWCAGSAHAAAPAAGRASSGAISRRTPHGECGCRRPRPIPARPTSACCRWMNFAGWCAAARGRCAPRR